MFFYNSSDEKILILVITINSNKTGLVYIKQANLTK
jgi:hypothetical protein